MITVPGIVYMEGTQPRRCSSSSRIPCGAQERLQDTVADLQAELEVKMEQLVSIRCAAANQTTLHHPMLLWLHDQYTNIERRI